MSIAKTLKALKSVFISVLFCPQKLATTKLFISLHGFCSSEIPAGGNIHQNSFSGSIDTKLLALLIDMSNHSFSAAIMSS